MKVQTIRSAKGEEMVVVSRSDFEHLRELADDRLDSEAAKAVLKRIASGEEEIVPQAVADRLLGGEHPIRVWREYRKLTQAELASRTGIRPAYLSQIEGGVRNGSISTLRAIAQVLKIDGSYVGLLKDR